ncbi:CBS domain-containing protein CBSX3, partial [Clarias magur]
SATAWYQNRGRRPSPVYRPAAYCSSRRATQPARPTRRFNTRAAHSCHSGLCSLTSEVQ